MVTSIGDELIDANTGHLGCILSIELNIGEDNKVYKSDENKCRQKVFDLVKETAERFNLQYFSLIITGANGANWRASVVKESLKERESMGGPYR
jgi:hypothetical protein